MAKEYKPGQFVSICGKLHRVKNTEWKDITCDKCPYDISVHIGKKNVCDDCIDKLLYKQYPEPISQPKHR